MQYAKKLNPSSKVTELVPANNVLQVIPTSVNGARVTQIVRETGEPKTPVIATIPNGFKSNEYADYDQAFRIEAIGAEPVYYAVTPKLTSLTLEHSAPMIGFSR